MGVLTNSPVFNKDSSKPNMDQELGGVRAIKFHNEQEESSCKTSIPEEEEEQDQEMKQRSLGLMKSYNNIMVSVVPGSKPEIPSYNDLILSESINDEEDDEEGFKTPTSLEHRIPPMVECPGAPRKKPSKTNPKRKAAAGVPSCRRRLVFDLSKEVESMFATSFVEDCVPDMKKFKNSDQLRD